MKRASNLFGTSGPWLQFEGPDYIRKAFDGRNVEVLRCIINILDDFLNLNDFYQHV